MKVSSNDSFCYRVIIFSLSLLLMINFLSAIIGGHFQPYEPISYDAVSDQFSTNNSLIDQRGLDIIDKFNTLLYEIQRFLTIIGLLVSKFFLNTNII